MTVFIMRGKYSPAAVRRINRSRTVKGTAIVRRCGGRLTGVYATMGDTDLLLIAEFPSVEKAMQASVALNKALDISFVTTPALSIADFDRLAGSRA